MAKFSIELPGSEHRGMNAVGVKLTESDFDDDDRLASLKFSSDGMDVKVRMMESDLRIFAYTILSCTNAELDALVD